ncbi:hypothetical protein [Oceanispirochaeta sp.]|jgi:hypothetical protein|uniref:hypothetical protein n=1 Tax=Oceanispirochaeta sp. TaxID=2035350 RepID=UPI002636A97F|nr:hypothetical protein [Oceanispirochaeta sp.]MDA3956889.1 hypothetical protein [Oceanispirochaeta sp.]
MNIFYVFDEIDSESLRAPFDKKKGEGWIKSTVDIIPRIGEWVDLPVGEEYSELKNDLGQWCCDLNTVVNVAYYIKYNAVVITLGYGVSES